MVSVLVNPVKSWTVFVVAVVTRSVLQASILYGCTLCLVWEFVCQNRHFKVAPGSFSSERISLHAYVPRLSSPCSILLLLIISDLKCVSLIVTGIVAGPSLRF